MQMHEVAFLLGRLKSPRNIRKFLGDSLHTFSSVRKYALHCWERTKHFFATHHSVSEMHKCIPCGDLPENAGKRPTFPIKIPKIPVDKRNPLW